MAAMYFGCTQDFSQFEPLGFGGAGTTSSSGGSGGGAPCTGDAACDDDNPCTNDSCNLAAGTCVSTDVPDGDVPGATDDPDDCVDPRCESGASTTVPDDSEVPDDGSDCTDDSCADGTAINAPKPEGTVCAAGECNDGGACIGCNSPEDCAGQDTFCSERTCINETCGVENRAANTPLPDGDQTDGDCILQVCDGNGGETITGDNDPPTDGNPCTDGSCVNDMPMQEPAPAGDPCGMGNLCNGNGMCVECLDNGDCTAPETCGGGGNMGQCGCTPTTCATLGLTCGMAPNGCGGTLNCNDGVTNGDETDVDCGGGAPPGGTCAVDCALGNDCNAPSDCVSNFCADGVCCNNGCGTACRSCALPATMGTCSGVPLGQDDPPLCMGDTMTCSGGGGSSCKLESGEPCTLPADCASGVCSGAPLTCQ